MTIIQACCCFYLFISYIKHFSTKACCLKIANSSKNQLIRIHKKIQLNFFSTFMYIRCKIFHTSQLFQYILPFYSLSLKAPFFLGQYPPCHQLPLLILQIPVSGLAEVRENISKIVRKWRIFRSPDLSPLDFFAYLFPTVFLIFEAWRNFCQNSSYLQRMADYAFLNIKSNVLCFIQILVVLKFLFVSGQPLKTNSENMAQYLMNYNQKKIR